MRKIIFTIGQAKRLAFQLDNSYVFEPDKPTILALHGAGGHPLFFSRISGLHQVLNFGEVLYLEAEKHGRLSRWNWENLDDHDFLAKVIDSLLSKGKKPNNIYIFGMSNGGCLANLFGHTCGLELGGIASICSAMPVYNQSIWKKKTIQHPNKIFIASSLYDQIMPYEGGETESDLSHHVLSHNETVRQWQLSLDCQQCTLEPSDFLNRIGSLKNIRFKYFSSDNSKVIFSLTSLSSMHTWNLIDENPIKPSMIRNRKRWGASVQKRPGESNTVISSLICEFMFGK